jgi:ATP-dependent RNA helicase DeaD
MGFREDIEKILESVPAERQTVFFSATMPKAFMSLTKKFQKDPELIQVVHDKLTAPAIEQSCFDVKEHQKPEILSRLIDIYNPKLSLIFCNTKKKVDEVAGHLQARGYSSDAIHGDMNQTQRDRVMAKFRKGTVDILVATDVAARGIDVDDIEAVFNYDVPNDEEYYVHRIGRTGRAGRSGHAFTFASGREIYKLRDIQRYTNLKIKNRPLPSLSDVEQVKTGQVLDKIKEVLESSDLQKYAAMLDRLLDIDAVVDMGQRAPPVLRRCSTHPAPDEARLENEVHPAVRDGPEVVLRRRGQDREDALRRASGDGVREIHEDHGDTHVANGFLSIGVARQPEPDAAKPRRESARGKWIAGRDRDRRRSRDSACTRDQSGLARSHTLDASRGVDRRDLRSRR